MGVDTHVPEGGEPGGAQPPPQGPREGPVVPLGPKHVGFQEGSVVPNHLDEGLAERQRVCDATFLAELPRLAPASLLQAPASRRAWQGLLSRTLADAPT